MWHLYSVKGHTGFGVSGEVYGTWHSADLCAAEGIVRTIGVDELGWYAHGSAVGCDPILDGATDAVDACEGDLRLVRGVFSSTVCGTETGYTP